MSRFRNPDALSGLAFAFFGFGLSLYTQSTYRLGSFYQMGTGMVPTMLGYLIAGFGLLLFLSAVLRAENGSFDFRARPFLTITAAVIAFAWTIRPLGLIPAVVSVVVIAALAEERPRPLAIGLLAAVLCVLSVLIFRVGLGMNLALIRLP